MITINKHVTKEQFQQFSNESFIKKSNIMMKSTKELSGTAFFLQEPVNSELRLAILNFLRIFSLNGS